MLWRWGFLLWRWGRLLFKPVLYKGTDNIAHSLVLIDTGNFETTLQIIRDNNFHFRHSPMVTWDSDLIYIFPFLTIPAPYLSLFPLFPYSHKGVNTLYSFPTDSNETQRNPIDSHHFQRFPALSNHFQRFPVPSNGHNRNHYGLYLSGTAKRVSQGERNGNAPIYAL